MAEQTTTNTQERVCDISTMCLNCGEEMKPEHAHMRCPHCGWRDACCEGIY